MNETLEKKHSGRILTLKRPNGNGIAPANVLPPDLVSAGGLGAVLAGPGVGKTSLLVQMAAAAMLEGKNVLHVGVAQPVRKVCLYYEQFFQQIPAPAHGAQDWKIWETVLPHRFVMTFGSDAFSAAHLEERISDLTEQSVFFPQMVCIDGWDMAEVGRSEIQELKRMAVDNNYRLWFAVRTRPSEPGGQPPAPFDRVADLFDLALHMDYEDGKVLVRQTTVPQTRETHGPWTLDPGTLLVI